MVPSLQKIWCRWIFTAPSVTPNFLATSLFERPPETSIATSHWRRLSRSDDEQPGIPAGEFDADTLNTSKTVEKNPVPKRQLENGAISPTALCAGTGVGRGVRAADVDGVEKQRSRSGPPIESFFGFFVRWAPDPLTAIYPPGSAGPQGQPGPPGPGGLRLV